MKFPWSDGERRKKELNEEIAEPFADGGAGSRGAR